MKNFILFIVLSFSSQAFCAGLTVLKSSSIYSPGQGYLAKKYILIKDGIIVDLKTNYKVQKEDQFYDYGTKTILPGFIDSHTHIFLTDNTFDGDFSGSLLTSLKLPQEKRYKKAKNRARILLKNGFTSIRDLGNSGRYLDKKLATEVKFKSNYPRIYFSGPGICIRKCQFSEKATNLQVMKEYDLVHDFSDAKKIIDAHTKNKVKFLKVYIDNIPSKGKMTDLLFSKIVLYAKEKKLKIVVHAIEKESVELVAKYPIHSIEHANIISKKAMKLILSNNIIIVPTDLGSVSQHQVIKANGHKKTEKMNFEYDSFYKERSKRIQFIVKQSANVAFGSDFYFPVANLERDYIKAIYDSIKNLKNFGMTNTKIISLLTIVGAKALDAADKIGDIRVGLFADLLILDGDPIDSLENIKKVHSVFKNGSVVKLK